MATTTTKWGLAIPTMSDPPAGGSQIAALGNSVDAALPQAGTLAARASVTHHVGLHYYAQDTDQLFLSDGTNWKEVPLVSIGTADIASGAVTAAKIEAQQAWQSLPLAGFTTSLSYFKDSLGNVHLRGDALTVGGATVNSGNTLATFPAGYRPGTTIYRAALMHSGGGIGVLSITSAGVLVYVGSNIVGGSSVPFSIAPYRAEN